MTITQFNCPDRSLPNPLATYRENSQVDTAWQILLTCTTPNLKPNQVEQLRYQLSNSVLDWSIILRLAAQHGMTAMLGHILNQFCQDLLPHDIHKIFQVNLHGTKIRNLFLTKHLIQILNLLCESGIVAIPYKGPTLLQSVYGNIGMRKFNDLDLLVSPKDFAKSKTLLLANGYQHKADFGWEASFYHPELQIEIDLHQSLVPSHFSGGINYEMLLQQCVELKFSESSLENATVLVLNSEYLFLLLCIYTVKDHCSYKLRLCQLVDAVNLIQNVPEFDWDIVCDIAQSCGCWRLVLVQTQLLHWIWPLNLPASFQKSIAEDRLVNDLAQAIYDRLIIPETSKPAGFGFAFTLRIYDHQFYLNVRERFADRLIYQIVWPQQVLLSIVIPNAADFDALSLPSQLHWLYYLFRPMRLIWKYAFSEKFPNDIDK
jgi:Uncharacterised nucleotidyltransferase